METYRTFAASEPLPDRELAAARVVGQDELLDYLREPLTSALIDTVANHEDALRSVYQPAITHASTMVGLQDGDLGQVTSAILDRLRTNLGQQSATITSVLSQLPADARDLVLTSTNSDGSIVTPGGIAVSPAELESGRITHVYDAPRPPLANVYEPGQVNSYVPPPIGVPVSTPTVVPGSTVTVPTGSSSTGTPTSVTVSVDPCCPPPPCPEDTIRRAPPTVVGAPVEIPPAPVFGPPRGVVAPPGKWDTADKRLCQTVDSYVRAFAAVGGEVRQIIFAGLNMGADLSGFLARLRDVNVIGVVFGFVSEPAKVLQKVFQEVGKMVMDYGALFAGPNADALVGLYFTKGWIKVLNNAQLGINFIVTAQINLDVVPQQTLAIVDYLINYLHPVRVPEIGNIENLYLANEITYDEAVCLAKLQNTQEKEFARGARARRTSLSPDLEIKFWQQWREPGNVLAERLRRYGMIDSADQQRLIDLATLLPPPSDAIRFSNRDVFDPQKLGRNEMQAEFNQQVGLREMFDAIGLEKKEILTRDGRRLELDLPFLYYMASYEECSPTQVYEMLHRLRPNRVNRYPLPKPGGGNVFPAPVDINIVRSLLKEKDYNPIWRDRLAAISFRPIGNTDIKNMYRNAVFGPVRGVKGFDRTNPDEPKPLGQAEQELVERYLDFGYAPNDAAAKALLTATQVDASIGRAARNKAMSRICSAYKVGGFTYEQALQQLINAGLERADAIEFLGGCDLDMRIGDLKLAVGGVRKQFVAATISEQQARNLLRGYGVAAERIDTLLSTWRLYMTQTRRELSAQQIGQFWEEGIINLADARARLANLGFDPTAANMILNHVRLGALAKSEKERDRVLKAQEAEQRRLAAQRKQEAKEQAAAQDKRMTRFLAGRSEKNLKQWLAERVITEQEVRETFTARGWNPADIDRWLTTNRPKE